MHFHLIDVNFIRLVTTDFITFQEDTSIPSPDNEDNINAIKLQITKVAKKSKLTMQAIKIEASQ